MVDDKTARRESDRRIIKMGSVESRVQMWISICMFILTISGGFISYIKTNSQRDIDNVKLLNAYSEKWQERMEKSLDGIRKEMASTYVSKPEFNALRSSLDDMRSDLKDIKTALDRQRIR